MRFNCGPTAAERRITREAKESAEHARLTQWHDFFCLWPRRLGNECVWLETIRRKGRYECCGYSGNYWYWEYRNKRIFP